MLHLFVHVTTAIKRHRQCVKAGMTWYTESGKCSLLIFSDEDVDFADRITPAGKNLSLMVAMAMHMHAQKNSGEDLHTSRPPDGGVLAFIIGCFSAHLYRKVQRKAPLVWSDVDVCIWEAPGEGANKDFMLIGSCTKHDVLHWLVELRQQLEAFRSGGNGVVYQEATSR